MAVRGKNCGRLPPSLHRGTLGTSPACHLFTVITLSGTGAGWAGAGAGHRASSEPRLSQQPAWGVYVVSYMSSRI